MTRTESLDSDCTRNSQINVTLYIRRTTTKKTLFDNNTVALRTLTYVYGLYTGHNMYVVQR